MPTMPEFSRPQASTRSAQACRRGLRARLAGTCAAALVAVAALAGQVAPAAANGEFYQLDAGEHAVTGVVAVERDRLAFGLGRSSYIGGYNWNLSTTYKWTYPVLGKKVTVRLGPSAQYDSDDETRFGVKAVTESYIGTDWGSVFLLGDFNTIKHGYFTMAQFQHRASGLGVQFSAQGDDRGYDENTITGLWKIPGHEAVSLRLGHKLREDESFIGVSINTF